MVRLLSWIECGPIEFDVPDRLAAGGGMPSVPLEPVGVSEDNVDAGSGVERPGARRGPAGSGIPARKVASVIVPVRVLPAVLLVEKLG